MMNEKKRTQKGSKANTSQETKKEQKNQEKSSFTSLDGNRTRPLPPLPSPTSEKNDL
jgi:hypothetical protein